MDTTNDKQVKQSLEPLSQQMRREYKKWAFSTKVYGTAYVVVRVFLIVASSIVAAKENLVDSSLGFLVRGVPVLALAVTIFTSLDTWMKPRDKWRGFMEDRDELCDIVIRAESAQNSATAIQNTETAIADELREEFKKLRARHREKNVY